MVKKIGNNNQAKARGQYNILFLICFEGLLFPTPLQRLTPPSPRDCLCIVGCDELP
jgi:hypothetical protein